MKPTLVIVDMQEGLFKNAVRYDASGVVERINALSNAVRNASGAVVFIQHDGDKETGLAPGDDDWELLGALHRLDHDPVIRKTACDAFYETELDAFLQNMGASDLIITGCATDFCVDTTIRAAASRDYHVTVCADAHTTCDRAHLSAKTIITHHNWMWENIIMPRSKVIVTPAAEIITGMKS